MTLSIRIIDITSPGFPFLFYENAVLDDQKYLTFDSKVKKFWK